MEIDPAALHLRFRDDASESLAPPDVAAFLRAATPEVDLDDALGVIPGPRPPADDAPLVVFFQSPDFGIPAPGYDHDVPDLTAWSVRSTAFGWVASVPPTTLRGPGPRRTTQVLAGYLALALPSQALAQAPPSQPPPVQTPKSQPTSAPAATDPAPAVAPAEATTPPPATTPTPLPQATAPKIDPSVTDAAWEGVDGFDVLVELKGGKVLRGRVGAVQAATFTLIDGSDGQILVIPKSGVSSLRAYIPPPIPTKTGAGLIAGGSILTSLGAPVFLTGVVFLAICPSCTYLHLPMLIVGGGALGGGIPMIVRGARQRTEFQKALQERRLSPMITRTPYGGWTGGLTLRF